MSTLTPPTNIKKRRYPTASSPNESDEDAGGLRED